MSSFTAGRYVCYARSASCLLSLGFWESHSSEPTAGATLVDVDSDLVRFLQH